MTDVVTRFAPSPTGNLHIGGARTALFNWAYARRHGGRFILRMEDTDKARSSMDSARRIIADLRWLGLDWDEGPVCPPKWTDALADGFDAAQNQMGERGPYFQSQRLDKYGPHVAKLLDAGSAYEDDGAVRFRMGRDIAFDDEVYGRIEVTADNLEDFIIRKSDGFPTFHMAVVIDDALMGVTHVLRGQEHLYNTTKHAALQDALGFARPTYAHMPSIMNADGSKMSKRDKAKAARTAAKGTDRKQLIHKCLHWHQQVHGLTDQGQDTDAGRIDQFLDGQSDELYEAELIANVLNIDLPEVEVADFEQGGYLPDVICNYIALLGWSPGNDLEKFDRAFLRDHFDINRINTSNASFDREKLLSFNADAIRSLPVNEFADLLYEHSTTLFAYDKANDDFNLLQFAEAYHARSETLKDPQHLGAFFFLPNHDVTYADKTVKKVLAKNEGEGYDVLREIQGVLAAHDPWEADSIEAVVKSFAQERSVGMGKVAQPLRVAVSGGTVSPPIGLTLAILGKERTLARIERCLSTTSKADA